MCDETTLSAHVQPLVFAPALFVWSLSCFWNKAAVKNYVNKVGTSKAFYFESYQGVPIGFAVRGQGLLKLQAGGRALQS